MLLIFSDIITIIFAIVTIKYIVNSFISKLIIVQKQKSIISHNPKNKIAIFIPVYKEADNVLNSMQYFSKLNYDIFYITTDKEIDGQNRNSTERALSKSIQKYKNIKIINYTGKTGFKSDQINFAIKAFKKEYDYFAIFDVDSRPDYKGLNYVAEYHDSNVKIFQMPSLYYTKKQNFIGEAFIDFQNKWTFCFEIYHWHKWEKFNNQCMYVVGHGLFIKNNLVLPSNTIGEDIKFGYNSSLRKRIFKLVPFFDKSCIVDDIESSIRQSSRWYNEEFKMIIGKELRSKTVFRYMQLLLWPLGTFFVLIAGYFFIINMEYVWLFVLLVIVAVYTITLNQIVRVLLRKKMSSKNIPGYLLKALINGIGPACSICRILFKRETKWE